MRTSTLKILAMVGLCGIAAQAMAADAHPDFSGNYVGIGGPPGQAAPNNQGFVNTPDVEKMVTAALKPWAKLLMEQTNTVVEDGGAVCSFAGPFRHTNTSPFMWLQTDEAAYFISSNLPTVGIIKIHMTDKHPEALQPRWIGHSIGHWEGDTLVMDTIGWNDRTWLGTANQPHSEELHVVRRFRYVGDGSLLEMHITVSDRRALKHPYSYVRYFRKSPKDFEELSDNVCNSGQGEPEIWWTIRQEAIEWEKTNPPTYDDAPAAKKD
ncbi:MAG: hypothetical protein QM696_06270 [Steroidobacteraceae bacterium]